MFSCKFKKPKSKAIFNANRIGVHLMDMIPKLCLPTNLKLKEKPLFLRKLRRRRAPNSAQNPAPIGTDVENLINSDPNSIMECSVRLERCDHLLNNTQIELMENAHLNGSSSNEQNDDDQEEDELEDITAQPLQLPSLVDEIEQDGTVQQEVDQPPKQENEILPHQDQDQNELVVNNVENDPKIAEQDGIVNNDNGSEKSSIKEINCELPKTSGDENIVMNIGDECDEQPQTKRPRISTDETNTNWNDCKYDKVPDNQSAPESVESPTNLKPNKVSIEQNLNLVASTSLKSLKHPITRKAYEPLHKNRCIQFIRNKSADNKNTNRQADRTMPDNESKAKEPGLNNSQTTNNTDSSVDNDFEMDIDDTDPQSAMMESDDQIESPMPDSPLGQPNSPLDLSESHNDLPSQAQSTLKTTTKPDTPIKQKRRSQINAPKLQDKKPTKDISTMVEPQCDQKQQPKCNMPVQKTFSMPIIDPAECFQSHLQKQSEIKPGHNENSRKIENRPNNDKTRKSGTEVESKQISTKQKVLAAATSSTSPTTENPFEKALKYYQTKSNQLQADNFTLRARLHQMENDIKRKELIISELKTQYIKLKADHDIRLKKAIQETKNKEWCVICKTNVRMFQMPTCSRKCLLELW